MAMNLAFIGVIPWQEAVTKGKLANENIAGAFMTKLHGERAAAALLTLGEETAVFDVVIVDIEVRRP